MQQLLPTQTNNDSIINLYDTLAEYLETKTAIYTIYQQADCLTDNEPNEFCEALTANNSRLPEFREAFSDLEYWLSIDCRALFYQVRSNTKQIGEKLNV